MQNVFKAFLRHVSCAVCSESCVNTSEYDLMTEEDESECGRPLNGTGHELIGGKLLHQLNSFISL